MIDLDHLHDNRSDPEVRAVLEDFERSRCDRSTTSRLGFALSFVHPADDVDDADADDVDDYDYDADDYDAADDAADDAANTQLLSQMLFTEPDMNNGLKIIQVPGRYGYSATLVGWLRRVSGDEWALLPGARSLCVTNTRRGLAWIAANGLGNDYKFTSEPSEAIEHVHRLIIRRAIAADEKVWVTKHEFVRPKDWSES